MLRKMSRYQVSHVIEYLYEEERALQDQLDRQPSENGAVFDWDYEDFCERVRKCAQVK